MAHKDTRLFTSHNVLAGNFCSSLIPPWKALLPVDGLKEKNAQVVSEEVAL